MSSQYLFILESLTEHPKAWEFGDAYSAKCAGTCIREAAKNRNMLDINVYTRGTKVIVWRGELPTEHFSRENLQQIS